MDLDLHSSLLNASTPLTAHDSRRADDRRSDVVRFERSGERSTMADRFGKGRKRRKREGWGGGEERREKRRAGSLLMVDEDRSFVRSSQVLKQSGVVRFQGRQISAIQLLGP